MVATARVRIASPGCHRPPRRAARAKDGCHGPGNGCHGPGNYCHGPGAPAGPPRSGPVADSESATINVT